jgi:hypothetical protein
MKMDKAKLMLKNGMHTVVPVTLDAGKLPKTIEQQGRTFTLHHTTVGTGTSEIRGVYTEVAK